MFFSVYFSIVVQINQMFDALIDRGREVVEGEGDSVNVCDKRCQLLQRSHILDLLIYSN